MGIASIAHDVFGPPAPHKMSNLVMFWGNKWRLLTERVQDKEEERSELR